VSYHQSYLSHTTCPLNTIHCYRPSKFEELQGTQIVTGIDEESLPIEEESEKLTGVDVAGDSSDSELFQNNNRR
jgi:hypothetical protein